jgi:hypothetical protein
LKSAPRPYQLKITLKRSRPAIWRRILVLENTPLDLLHLIIQRTMGWSNVHLHDFVIGKEFYGDPAVDNVLGFKNECDYILGDLITDAGQVFTYEYDFGDDWEHEIKLEKITPQKRDLTVPFCVTGARACPPEECGGIWNYYKLLKILKDKSHPEFKQTREWFGYEFDPEEFARDPINKSLSELRNLSEFSR